ncbi:MAG: DUF4367 domain-containing protein [Oscillospiraceae bacterium]|nr:DUF4367 domain-containing protein [Oscillospiraceae bacterium]
MNRNDSSFDEVFDMLLTEAAIQADKNIGTKLQEPENIIFSEEHEQKMRKLFRDEQRKLFKKKFVRYLMRCACILLIVVVVVSVSVFSVNAWRAKFLNFIMKSEEPNTNYHFDDGEAGFYSDDDINIGYIPNGFIQLDNMQLNENIFLLFKNQEQYFILTIQNADTISNVDTEGAFVEELTLSDKDVIFINKDSVKTLIWGDEQHSYMLYGNIEKNELIKIAKSVLIGQN